MPVYTTACPRNCYSTCSMTVHIENGKMRSIEGHPDNKATSGAVCLKGLSYMERQYSKDRILTPLLRKSDSSEFKPVSWDNAIGIIAEKLQHYKENFGSQSVFFYSASGTKGLMNNISGEFWEMYGGCTRTYGDLCWPAGLEATRLTLGDNKHSAAWDIANAKLIILWGKNPAETNIHQMVFIEKALENGGKLIVIDPRRTQSSERADLLIQPRPGTDGALALAVANLLIQRNYIDKSFIKKHVSGFSEFLESVQLYTPEKTADITDVPVDYIVRLAHYIGTTKPVTICSGFGMQRYTNSGQAMRAIIALLCITGNIGKPGAGWIYANLQSQIFDKIKDPVAFYPPENPNGKMRVSISTSKIGADMLKQVEPPLKMIWVERANPVTSNPETNTTLKAFRALDFRVVVDQFMTDTALEADIILPAKTMFEQSDVIGAYWHSYIQLKQKILDPPGEVKPESEIYRMLAEKLGFSTEEIDNIFPGPGDDGVDRYLENHLNSHRGLSLEKLQKGPVSAPGQQEVAWCDFNFPTPSGKIELLSVEANDRWGVNKLPDYRESYESVKSDSPEAKKYPLYFMTPNTKNRIHSQFNNLEMIRRVSPKPLVTMSPKDAQDRSIESGDRVKIYNDRGILNFEAFVDFSIKDGCVSVTNGWWIAEGGTVNFLSAGRETDMGYGAAFHDNLVEVEKVS